MTYCLHCIFNRFDFICVQADVEGLKSMEMFFEGSIRVHSLKIAITSVVKKN